MANWLIMKNNYVVNVILWDGVTPYNVVDDHDLMKEDPSESVGIGDWYEEAEDMFYRPLGIPHDWPDELKPLGDEPLT